jgi:glucose-1-phosphate adenylyltransferase
VVLGTADAVYQNIDIIESYNPEYMIVLAGDHVYKMDYEIMLQQHATSGADVTVGCIEVPRMEATGFGVMHVDATIASSASSRSRPIRRRCRASPTRRWPAWASTCSKPRSSSTALRRDAADPSSSRDFGKDIIPYIVKHGKAMAHPLFAKSCVKSDAEAEAYWRDVGTVDSFWEANIELTDVIPALDLTTISTGRSGPTPKSRPPAKFVHREPAGADLRKGRWFRAAAWSRAQRSFAHCCSPACMCIRTPRSKVR